MNKSGKSLKQAETSFRKGLVLLKEKKLFKQAVFEFKIALENNPAPVQAELEDMYESYKSKNSVENALAVGLALFHVRKEEELALQLGRYSRQLGEYKQANNLYRQALKINRSSQLAFNNLAASMGKVDWYDDDIPMLIKRYFTASGLVLPEYLTRTDTLGRIQGNLKKEYLKSKKQRLEELEDTIQLKMNEGDEAAAEKMLEEMNRLIDESERATYASIKTALQGHVKRKLAESLNSKQQQELSDDIYNTGLYLLKNKDIEPALEHFLILKHKGLSFEELEICLAISYALTGKRKDAVLILTDKLKKDPDDRLLNINLAQLHKAEGNKLLSYKYQIISASLLEKSDGLVLRSEILKQADFHFGRTNLDKALKLYKIVAHEKKDIHAWLRIGDIHLAKGRQLEALDTFKEMKIVYPDSQVVQNKLMEVHNRICTHADALFNDTKFKQSAIIYERALKLVRSPETLKKLISAYKQLHNHRKAHELSEELTTLKAERRAEEKTRQRTELIEQGKRASRQKNYQSAIYNFENAFRIEPDEEVFSTLAKLYEALKQKSALKDLVDRWNHHKEVNHIDD